MDTIQSKAKKQPPYKSALFWLLPIGTLILVFTLISMAQNVSGFSDGLKDTLSAYELPIALLSSCAVTLLNWYVQHQSSKLSPLEEQQAINTHLRSEYSASEQLLVKQFGKLASDREFTFITAEDLPAIHSHIYSEKELLKHGKLMISDEVLSVFKIISKVRKESLRKA